MPLAQDPRFGTMLEVLTRHNPELRLTATSKSLTYPHPWWPQVVSSNLSEWKEFSYETLVNGWGHILEDDAIIKGEVEEEISDTQRSISDEDKVDAIALQWTIKSTRDALKRAFEIMRPDAPYEIFIAKHGCKLRDQFGHVARPDMAIYHRIKKEDKLPLVLGDNKTSNWRSDAATGRSDTGLKNMMPLRQIAAYCMLGKTRYGWIMSDHELFVCRVSRDQPGDGRPGTWTVEYKSIPWTAAGPGVLTVNLSIWWLGMMSLPAEYRAVETRTRMMPIDFWWENKDGKRTTGYTHHLSGRRLPADKPPTGCPTHPRQEQPPVTKAQK